MIAVTDNERVVEVPWLISRLGTPRRILDVGHADSAYAAALLATGADVILQDVRPFTPLDIPPGAAYARHVGGVPWPAAWGGAFDLVTCVSVLDHVGLDAYGQPADDTALPALVAELRRVLAPDGRLLLSVPVGRDLWTTHPGGGQRVFSGVALATLFDGWHRLSLSLFRRVGDTYQPVDSWRHVRDAGYPGTRAEAVACMELTP